MKKIFIGCGLWSVAAMGVVNSETISSDIWAVCKVGSNQLQIRFPAEYYKGGMTYLRQIAFKYGDKELAIESQPGADHCHVLGMCPSFVTIGYQLGSWTLTVDGKHLGTVEFGWSFDGDTRSNVESCRFEKH